MTEKCAGPALITNEIIVTKVINIFEKFHRCCVQNINIHLFSYLPHLKVNIGCNIELMLAPNIYISDDRI